MKTIILIIFALLIGIMRTPAGDPIPGHVVGWGYGGGQYLSRSTGDSLRYVAVGGHELTNVIAVACSGLHAMALKADGTLVAWGYPGSNPELLDIPTNLNNVVAISLAADHNVALKKDGSVVAWGYNSNSPRYSEIVQPQGASNIVAVASGTLALKKDGAIEKWGTRRYGNPPSGLSNVVAVACGGQFGDHLALRKDGTVVEWPAYYAFDVYTMPPDLTNVTAIASGPSHALALKSNGMVESWGFEKFDFMNPNEGEMTVPVGLTNVVAIAAGPYISFAIKKGGTLAVWGDNRHHQVDFAKGLSNIVAVAAGQDFCLAIQTSGTINETNIPFAK